ncbi:TPA: hypothetical protein JA361_09745 [Legionella pneumophila]|nr:hypothetical protein [Legionella pneumophila]HAT8183608.1 hypothetical protein [Legionella pneumophila]
MDLCCFYGYPFNLAFICLPLPYVMSPDKQMVIKASIFLIVRKDCSHALEILIKWSEDYNNLFT